MKPQFVNHRVPGRDSFAKYAAAFLRCPVPSSLQPALALSVIVIVPVPTQSTVSGIYQCQSTGPLSGLLPSYLLQMALSLTGGLLRVTIDDFLLLSSLLRFETLLNTFLLDSSSFKHLISSIFLDLLTSAINSL